MKISVIGSGYVGLSTGVGFAKKGNKVICVDVIKEKVEQINKGESPIFEPHMDEYLKETLANGKFEATTDIDYAIKNTEVSFISVGTPSKDDGSIDLKFIDQVAKDIGAVLKTKDGYHVIVVKSTVVPGTTEDVVLKNLEAVSGKKAGRDFGLCMNPEFLREGKALEDFLNPNRIVIGEFDKKSGDVVEELYKNFGSLILRTNIKTAEMIKYANNALLATKVSFSNEVGNICKKLGIDVYDVMKGVGMDDRFSPKFLSAGAGFGGSCVTPNTNVLTIKGYKPIEDVLKKDLILTKNGTFEKVLKAFKRKIDEEIIEVKPQGLEPFQLTFEHPVLFVKTNRKKHGQKRKLSSFTGDFKPSWAPVSKLSKGDYLATPYIKHGWKDVITPNQARLLGYYLAEGSIHNRVYKRKSKRNIKKQPEIMRISFTFNSNEKQYHKDVMDLVKKEFGIDLIKLDKPKRKTTTLRKASRRLGTFLIKYGGKGASSKRMHPILYKASILVTKEILRGWWCGDGSKSTNIYSCATVSKQLYLDLKYMLHKLGISFTTKFDKARTDSKGVKHKPVYTIRIRNYKSIKKMNDIIGWDIKKSLKLERKTSFGDKNWMYVPIKSIAKKRYKGYVYNLHVDNHPSYMLENAMVHNCFPKDVAALVAKGKELGHEPKLLEEVLNVNKRQKIKLVGQLEKKIDNLSGKKIAVLGLAFKPDSDDIREAAALDIICSLKENGAVVSAYDPKAEENAKEVLPDIHYAKSPQEALKDADACLIVTEWNEFKNLTDKDFEGMKNKVIIEGRKVLDPEKVSGFEGICW